MTWSNSPKAQNCARGFSHSAGRPASTPVNNKTMSSPVSHYIMDHFAIHAAPPISPQTFNRIKRALTVVFILLTILTILTLTGFLNTFNKSSRLAQPAVAFNRAGDYAVPQGFNGIAISTNVTTVDVVGFTYELHVETVPKGASFVDPKTGLLSVPVVFYSFKHGPLILTAG